MADVLSFIKSELEKINVPYEFGEWTSEVSYPYFVGEYSESESYTEDGQEDTTFILTGFSRSSGLALEEIKGKIQAAFPPVGGNTAILENGSGIAVFYSRSFPVPTGEEGLKKIQINLSVKFWKVI